MKKCKICGEKKPLSDYYKNSAMKDGHLNACISCARQEAREKWHKKKKNPKWREKERKRQREKYHRLNYKEKHKPSREARYETTKKYREKFPEKYRAKNQARRKVDCPEGFEMHHWSYKKKHQTDVIFLKPAAHNEAHIYMVYDKEEKMYRGQKGQLLDSKEKHVKYLKSRGVSYG